MIHRTLHLTSHRVPLRRRQLELMRRNEAVLGFTVKVWSDDDNLALVRRVVPQHEAAFTALPHGVMRADVARLLYLHAEGGWYADTDYRWFRDPSELVTDSSIVLPVSRESDAGEPLLLGNAVMASEPGHPFWVDVVEHIFSIDGVATTGKDTVEARTGPGAITDGWHRFAFDEPPHLPARRHFHSPQKQGASRADIADDVYGQHLVAGSWRPPVHRAKAALGRALRSHGRNAASPTRP